MHSTSAAKRQKGAVILTVALSLLFLLGFMGIAIDFGRLFIVKTELQTAMDSCALAAARELDGAIGALDRAASAGVTAGNLNKIHFQQETAGIEDNGVEVTFSDRLDVEGATYSRTFTPENEARYAKCTHTRSGLAPWLLQAFTAFSGNASYAATRSVFATAVATLAPAQTNCMLPVGVCQKSGGFAPGEWIIGVNDDTTSDEVSGNFRWLDFYGKGGGTAQVKDLMTGAGQCDLPGTDTFVKSGNSNGAIAAWNTRFGIYKGGYKFPEHLPDFTGYSWYYDDGVSPPSSLVPPSGLTGRYADPSVDGYPFHRGSANASDRPYQGISGLDIKANEAITGQDHIDSGASRRIAPVPIVDCGALDSKVPVKVSGIACVLLLHPIEKKGGSKSRGIIWIEYINDATAIENNACPTIGLPGGSSGVKVPALVQ
jgi:Flp pilus assembly protein TadG